MTRLEGWPAGIRLAVLSSRQRGSHDLLSSPKVGGLPYLMDHLPTKVLEGQPPAIQDYLLRTAVLERFCAPLCEAVCFCPAEGVSSRQAESPPEVEGCELSGQAFLEWLEVGDLFVVPLDDRQQWYRYHRFFQQLLRKQLQRRCRPDEIAALHARASAWFAQEGLIDEAIDHALAAGDELGAAQLVEENARALLNEEKRFWTRSRMRRLSRCRGRLISSGDIIGTGRGSSTAVWSDLSGLWSEFPSPIMWRGALPWFFGAWRLRHLVRRGK